MRNRFSSSNAVRIVLLRLSKSRSACSLTVGVTCSLVNMHSKGDSASAQKAQNAKNRLTSCSVLVNVSCVEGFP